MSGPWDNQGEVEGGLKALPLRRVHLPIQLAVQGTVVNVVYLVSIWLFFTPLLLTQPIWLTVLGFLFFGFSGLYAAFSLCVLAKTFIFGVMVLDTRRS